MAVISDVTKEKVLKTTSINFSDFISKEGYTLSLEDLELINKYLKKTVKLVKKTAHKVILNRLKREVS